MYRCIKALIIVLSIVFMLLACTYLALLAWSMESNFWMFFYLLVGIGYVILACSCFKDEVNGFDKQFKRHNSKL